MSWRQDISVPANHGSRYLQISFRNEICHSPSVLRQEHVPISADFAHVSKISTREEISCRQENFLLGRKKPRTRPGETNQEPAVFCADRPFHNDATVRRALTGRVEFSLRKEIVMPT